MDSKLRSFVPSLENTVAHGNVDACVRLRIGPSLLFDESVKDLQKKIKTKKISQFWFQNSEALILSPVDTVARGNVDARVRLGIGPLFLFDGSTQKKQKKKEIDH